MLSIPMQDGSEVNASVATKKSSIMPKDFAWCPWNASRKVSRSFKLSDKIRRFNVELSEQSKSII